MSDFWWGTTASSVSTEGAAPAADWSAWERSGRAPASGTGNGFGTNAGDDAEMLVAHGLPHIRLTLEWARIEPEPGKVDGAAVEHYRRMLEAIVGAGAHPWLTLHHTSLPGWFADDLHGFADNRARGSHWARHVDRCAELYDDLATGWCPIDDPIGWALRGNLLGTRPPGRIDVAATHDAVEGAIEAAHIAGRLLGSGSKPVMAVMGLPPVHPLGPEATSTAELWEQVIWDSWLDALDEGQWRLPWRGRRDRPDMVEHFDLLGIAYHHPIAIDATDGFAPYPESGRVDGSGFAPNAEELGVVLRRVADRTSLPIVVAANGIATDDDDWRDQILRETVHQLDLAIADGVDLRGWFHDTAIDGYEWTTGFERPKGLFTRDRRAKPSLAALPFG